MPGKSTSTMIQGWEFLAAIAEKAPDSYAEVMAYSDWLEEQGRAAEASLIRQAKACRVHERDGKPFKLQLWMTDGEVGSAWGGKAVMEPPAIKVKVVSSKTLRRKLQNKRKKGKYWRECPECKRDMMKKVVGEDFSANVRGEWKLHWVCYGCKHCIELFWNGRKSKKSLGVGTADDPVHAEK